MAQQATSNNSIGQWGGASNDLDSRLLNAVQQNDAARDLRERKMAATSGMAKTALDTVDAEGQEGASSFRELVAKSRMAQQMAKKLKEKILSPGKQFFSK